MIRLLRALLFLLRLLHYGEFDGSKSDSSDERFVDFCKRSADIGLERHYLDGRLLVLEAPYRVEALCI